MERLVVFGPPGTGKSEFDLRLVEEWTLRGIGLPEISYVTFMKSAAADACKRMGIPQEDQSGLWFRTLHSTCFKLLGATRKDVLTSVWMKEFGKSIGLRMDDDGVDQKFEEVADAILAVREATAKRSKSPGSVYRGIYDLSRLMCRGVEDLDGVRRSVHPEAMRYIQMCDFSPQVYGAFVEKYEAAKGRDGKLDFVDMLEKTLRRGLFHPTWRYAVVDECQDLSPLQFAVVDSLYRNCEVIVMSGDDDQAIMAFQGSSAGDFLRYRAGARIVELRQTWRFGPPIVDFSAKISARIGTRHPKTVIGLQGKPGKVSDVYDFESSQISGGDMLLHRHVAGCNEIARNLVARGMPFWSERGINPLARSSEIRGYSSWKRISRGERVSMGDVQSLMETVPSIKDVDGEKVRLVKHGVKREVSDANPGGTVALDELTRYFSGTFLAAAQKSDPSFLDVPFFDYYEKLTSKGHDFEDRPKTVVTTIHGSKGRQAPRVWLWSETYPKALMGGDDEHRVAYVGATRAQDEVRIVRQKMVGDWTGNYSYPDAQK